MLLCFLSIQQPAFMVYTHGGRKMEDHEAINEMVDGHIQDTLKEVYLVWKENNDLPFGQFILNPFEEEELYNKVDDNEFVKRIKDHYGPI